MRNRFLEVVATSLELEPSTLGTPDVSVIGLERRAGSGVAAGYVLGDHFVISADPAIASILGAAVGQMEATMASWHEFAASSGGEAVGGARMQLLGPELPVLDALPARFRFRSLKHDDPGDRALIQRLIETSDADDLDEAEIELDDLDEIIEVIVDDTGEIVTFAAARPFDMAPAFGDIGILTRPEHRGIGLGATAVAALCPRLRASGLEPLYRCDDDNLGSVKLSANLGFEIATQLFAYRFPTQPTVS